MKKAYFSLIIGLVFLSSCWKNNSPEDLIRLKQDFKKQVASFEKKKEKANDNVIDGLSSMSTLKETLQETKNQDKEFAKVYGDWEKVDRKVKNLTQEFEDLKTKSNNLFLAMETQTNSLSDQETKNTLTGAIKSAKTKYGGTLAKTQKAIDKLKILHGDAVEVVKALEVAVALNSFDNINEQMKSIEARVEGIMSELNVAVVESKKLYEKQITELK